MQRAGRCKGGRGFVHQSPGQPEGAGRIQNVLEWCRHIAESGRAAQYQPGAALEVINFDQNVSSIFINIFGGITRGEEVAKGIVEALGRVDLRAPIVIRLDGTNAEEGRQILADAGIPESKLRSEPTMLDAARAAVALAKN